MSLAFPPLGRLAPLALAALLSACGWVEIDASDDASADRATASARPAAAVTRTADGGRSVTVRSGETVYGLAATHDATPRQVISLNKLKPPYDIQVGQRLLLPPPQRLHRVRPGESLGSIAELYRASTGAIAAANHLDAPYPIRAGEVIGIPAGARQMAAKPRPVRSDPAPVAVQSLPPERAARQSRVVTPPTRPKTGPPGSTATAMPAAKSEPVAKPKPRARPVPTARAIAPVRPKPKPEPKPAAQPRPAPRGPALATPGRTGGFLAPIEGPVIAAFGSQADGRKNDGVNIAAPKGAPVRAAADGDVVYAGGALQGYGNLILLRHSDGWVTAYAHLDRILAKRGARVVRGQAIGAVGATGGVSAPQLHFEMRKNNQAIDPTGRLAAK